MKQIAIYGAFDRFNYGDLLFPLILEHAFKNYSSEYKFEYYGTIASDLSGYGGKPTKSVEELFSYDNLEDDSMVIVAGGEVLAPRWIDIYSCLLPNNLTSYNNALYRNIPKNLLLNVKPTLQTTELEMPFVIAPEDFNRRVKVVYNTVGGSSLAKSSYPSNLLNSIIYKLEKSTYISVRDQKTFDILTERSSSISPRLAPDSASLMSLYYSKNNLLTLINPSIATWINQNKDNYYVIQIARRYANEQSVIEVLTHEIEDIYHRYQLPVVLCPIGTATGHEDQIPLAAIHKAVKTPSILIDNGSIFDIMAIIANSRLFIGTSLHGAITAMSFAVPNLALTLDVHKLTTYLRTWGFPTLQDAVPINRISTDVARALSVSKTQLENKRQNLIDASLESFDFMQKALCESETTSKAYVYLNSCERTNKIQGQNKGMLKNKLRFRVLKIKNKAIKKICNYLFNFYTFD